MRIGLTVKLLVILGITSAVSVLAMGLAARWSFQHGFLDYQMQRELKRVAPLEEALVEAYEKHGSWDHVQHNPGGWLRFVDDALAPSHASQFRGPIAPSDAAEGGFGPEPPQPIRPPWDSTLPAPPRHGAAPPFPPPGGLPPSPRAGQSFAPSGALPPDGPGAGPPPGPRGLASRLRLLDDQRRVVAGGPRETGEALLITLESDGVVIGWLGLSPPLWLEDEPAQRFYSQHNRSLLLVALGSLTLAILLGWVFGEGILRRVRGVAGGARRLAKGDYGTRLAPKGRDELAGLARDFNHLAAALERNEDLRRRGMADVSHERPIVAA